MKIRNFTPSITNITKAIRKIAGEQPIYYRTQKFINLLKENELLLLKLIKCKKGKIIFLTTSGTGAMEATVNSLLSKKDKIMIINGGVFGNRWYKICKYYNLNINNYKIGFGKNLNFKNLERKDRKSVV